MFGCHNCGSRPKPGTPYEKTLCAKCRTMKNPPPMSHYQDDPSTFHHLQVPHHSMVGDGEFSLPEDESVSDTFPSFRKEDLNGLLQALARSVRVLVELKERHPRTYRILDAKMSDPNLSYADLARRFECRKQNVQYHLKKAVEFCPELSCALIIDSRFSAGYNALKECAKMEECEKSSAFTGKECSRT